jgi:uncharacterized protein YecT (DUF1311 family)
MSRHIKRSAWIATILLGCLMLSSAAQGASFDCAKAGTKVEKMICDNPEISKLDEELSAAYKTALQDQSNADAIKQAQKQWMKERNGCANSDCVRRAYEVRLHGLIFGSGKPILKSNQKPHYTVTKGQGWSVCENYARYLNSIADSDAYPVCHPKLSSNFPDLKEPDWMEMDITTHLELIYSIEKILSPSEHDRPVDTFVHWKSVFVQQIRNGETSPRLRRTHLALLDDAPVETILAYEPDRNSCEKWIKKMKCVNANRTSLFLWNEHEQKIQAYISSIAFAGLPRELLLYQGKPFTFWIGWEPTSSTSVLAYVTVNYFKKVGAEPYANLFACQINFDVPRDLSERILK